MPRSNFLDAFRLKIKIFLNDTFRYVSQLEILARKISSNFWQKFPGGISDSKVDGSFDRKYFRLDFVPWQNH